MIYLINAFVFIILFVLFVVGFLIKGSEIKEKNFCRKINKHFWHKYIILTMLISGIVFLIISYIISILHFNIGKYLLLYSFLYLLISMEWAYLYMQIDIYYNFSKNRVINEFILFFATSKVFGFKYLEIITWFSMYNHYYYLQRSNDEVAIDNLIAKLELLLRPSINGLSLAHYNENDFKILCKKINGKSIRKKVSIILQEEEKLRSKIPERNKLFHLFFDRNILIYLVIIGIHIFASVLVSEMVLINFIGNLLFYLPSDILIILVYKGVVKDK